MTPQEVDDYLARAPHPHRSTLEALRALLRQLVPEAEEGIHYGVPTFSVAGHPVAGFGFSKNHCTYFPMSGSITAELSDRLAGYATAKGSVRFAVDQPLPAEVVGALVLARQAQIARGKER